MIKPISRPVHGIADYAYVPLVFSAPNLLGFKNESTAANLCRIISSGVLASTLLTRAEWGAYKVVPFKKHLLLDIGVSALSLAAPWLFHFARNRRARNAFLIIGAIGALVTALSRPEEMDTMK